MATHVTGAPRRGFPSSWVSMLAALVLVVAVGGVAFAVGHNSAPNRTAASVPAQSNLGPRITGMMPWMQAHVGDIVWMQNHMGDVTWMRSHWNRWQWMQGHLASMRWMQSHAAQWSWMRGHMGDIGWMHDHFGQWNGWRSDMMGPGGYSDSGSGSNGPPTGSRWSDPGMEMGW
jgi:hypothetical protein